MVKEPRLSKNIFCFYYQTVFKVSKYATIYNVNTILKHLYFPQVYIQTGISEIFGWIEIVVCVYADTKILMSILLSLFTHGWFSEWQLEPESSRGDQFDVDFYSFLYSYRSFVCIVSHISNNKPNYSPIHLVWKCVCMAYQLVQNHVCRRYNNITLDLFITDKMLRSFSMNYLERNEMARLSCLWHLYV